MKPVHIYALYNNRPDFIKLQYDSLKKHLKDKFKFTIVDNSYWPGDKSEEIEAEAFKERANYIRMEHGEGKKEISSLVRDSLNHLWKSLDTKDVVVFMDCDVFLIGDVSFNLHEDMSFCPQYTNGKVWPWTGFMIFDMERIIKEDVSFNFHNLDGSEHCSDVGSALSIYIEKHHPDIALLERVEVFDQPSKRLEVLGFPHPYSLDFIGNFAFHYKTSSNYALHCTPEYNEAKTKALKRLLE